MLKDKIYNDLSVEMFRILWSWTEVMRLLWAGWRKDYQELFWLDLESIIEEKWDFVATFVVKKLMKVIIDTQPSVIDSQPFLRKHRNI